MGTYIPAARLMLGLLLLAFSACAPAAAPQPTAAPAKPAAASAPAATAKPAESKPTAAPTAASKPTEKPAAKPAFDEKAIADFYKGKTVRIIVGAAPGGGYDLYARALARTMSKYVPGNPTIIVENNAGAGGIVAANQVYASLPKDGTVIAHYPGNILKQQLFGASGVEFDANKFQYLGAAVPNTTILVVSKRSGFTSAAQAIGPNAREMILGAVAPGTGSYDGATLYRGVLGAKIKLVPGYQGTAPIGLAIEAGEVDGYFNAWTSVKSSNAEQIKGGDWLILLQIVDKPHQDLPRVPTAASLATTEEQRQTLRFGTVIPDQSARPFVVAPEVPTDRVAMLREAFVKTMADKDFLADAEKAKLDIEPVSGQELQRLIGEYLSMPADWKTKLQKIME